MIQQLFHLKPEEIVWVVTICNKNVESLWTPLFCLRYKNKINLQPAMILSLRNFYVLLTVQSEPSSSVRPENTAAWRGCYLNEFSRGEDGLVGHGGCCYYNRGIVLLLQSLIEHLHVEETQEAQPAGWQETLLIKKVWKEFNSRVWVIASSSYQSTLSKSQKTTESKLHHLDWSDLWW